MSTGGGKFSESQSISVNKYVAKKSYYAHLQECATE